MNQPGEGENFCSWTLMWVHFGCLAFMKPQGTCNNDQVVSREPERRCIENSLGPGPLSESAGQTEAHV